jgi:hypothetical protein
LRESLKAQRKSDSAALVDAEFNAAWQYADADLQVSGL